MCLRPAIKLYSGFTPFYFLVAEIPLFSDIRKGFSVDLILAYILALSRTFQEVFAKLNIPLHFKASIKIFGSEC